jgi:hypothetical protein
MLLVCSSIHILSCLDRLVRPIMFTEIMPGMRFMRDCLNAMHVGMVMDILVLRVLVVLVGILS